MIHYLTGQSYDIVSFSSWIGIHQIINFPVALFIFMAGYFINPGKMDDVPKKRGVHAAALSNLECYLFNQEHYFQ